MSDLLGFLQKNGQWIASIALIAFAAAQFYHNIIQSRYERNRKKAEFYQNILNALLPYPKTLKELSDIVSMMLVFRPNIKNLLGKNALNNFDNLYDLILILLKSKSDTELCIHERRAEYIMRVASIMKKPKFVEKRINKI